MKKFLLLALAALLALAPCRLRADMAAPELPKTEELKGAPETAPGAKADVSVPENEPEVKKEAVTAVTAKPGHFRWGNLFLGALGGAALGFLALEGADQGGGLDASKTTAFVGGGALAGGLLSVLLGATSPLPATPPDMSRNHGPMLVLALHF